MAFFVFLIRDPINTFAFASQVSIADEANMEGRMTPNPLSTRRVGRRFGRRGHRTEELIVKVGRLCSINWSTCPLWQVAVEENLRAIPVV
jgi:hypothetical protein